MLPDDDRLGRDVERERLREGRAADPRAADEAAASFVLAERLGLHPGDTIRLHFVRSANFPAAAAPSSATSAPASRVHPVRSAAPSTSSPTAPT